MDIKNIREFEQIFGKIIAHIIDDISNEILAVLKHSIDLNTYEYEHGDPYNYQYAKFNRSDWTGKNKKRTALPTFEFREAFMVDTIKNTISSHINEIFYNWRSMSIDKDMGIHYDMVKGDIREALATMLNIDGELGGKARQPYFDITMTWIDANWDRLISKYFRKYGITHYKTQ